MKTRKKTYDMSDDEFNGRYRNEYTEEYEGDKERESEQRNQQEEDEERDATRSRSKSRSEPRSEPTPSCSNSSTAEQGKKQKKHKHSRKRNRSGEDDRSSTSESLSNLDLLNNLTNYFEGRFQEIKQELIEENQAMCNKMNKRFKVTEHTFKKAGNRFQFNHNMEVASKVEEAQEYLERKKPSVRKAKEALAEGMSIIDERNKDILVADTSEGGWDTVNEYKKKQIADNSDDDKKLRRADTDALRKREKKKKKYKQSSQPKWQPYQPYQSYQPYQPRNDFHHRSNDYDYNHRSRDNNYRAQKPSSTFRRREKCFSCGGTDHWKQDCPYTGDQTSSHHYYNNTN